MNLQLLHRHCHDQKTTQDGSNQAKTGQGITDKDHLIEEPCAEKSASTVLKDSLCQALRKSKAKRREQGSELV
jgi:RNA-directed DNA polymerase